MIIAVSFAVAELPLTRKTAESMSMKKAVPTKSLESYFNKMYMANVKPNTPSTSISGKDTAEATLRTIKANGVSLSK